MLEILRKYANGEIERDEANAALIAAGSTLRIEDKGRSGGWTEQEIEEGFFEIPKAGSNVIPETPDKRRRLDLKNKVTIQRVRSGHFACFYDEDGYCVRTRRVVME